MPLVLTSIAIDAPVQRVWEVLTDLDAYSEWNPVILNPRGELRPGGDFDFKIKMGRLEAPIAARIVRADGTELRWEGPRNALQKPLASGNHFFRLEALEDDRTRLVHGERFSGPLFSLPWRVLGPQVERGYEVLNRKLKERAES